MGNKIKFARSLNKLNIPAILDYGEPGYIKNQEMVIGNGDGTGFTVNDWNNLINRPEFEEEIITIVAGESFPAFTPLAINSSGQGIIADKSTTALARVYGFSLEQSITIGQTIHVQVAGDITNPDWSFTPGMTYYLGDDGALVNTYLGFVSTDYVSPLGIAKSAHTLAVNIELGFSLGVLSINGRSGSITLTAPDVGLSIPVKTIAGGTGLTTIGDPGQVLGVAADGKSLEYKTITDIDLPFNPQFDVTTTQSEEILNYLAVNHVRGCRFDVVYYSSNLNNLRMESIVAVIGADDAVAWNATSTQNIGDTTGIQPVLTISSGVLTLGFAITEGEWLWSVVCYPVTLPGQTASYTALPL